MKTWTQTESLALRALDRLLEARPQTLRAVG